MFHGSVRTFTMFPSWQNPRERAKVAQTGSRIYRNDVKQSASRAAFQMVGSLIAQHSRQNPTFQLKNRQTFTLFTNDFLERFDSSFDSGNDPILSLWGGETW
jgi:hypothetical protein